MGKWQCRECGYVYDPGFGDPDNGVLSGTTFDELSEDWICPVCGAELDQFEPYDEEED
ncbi:MAG: rubredoxin [candidate division WOR-3 bacterium]|nr:MAG: rubredoxin [candidate division WOR-3 bacterium]